MHADRHIPLEGASNFRDFGGYPTTDGRRVKWRRLFRSDRLSDLTAADYARLSAHGIRFVYDLRRDSEAEASPTRWPGPGAPQLVRSPLFDDSAGPNTFQRISADEEARHDAELSRAIMGEMYHRLVAEPGPLAAYRRIFIHLASPDGLPVLVHCSGGKDRTGVICALIQLALGVARADVVDDFMLTRRLYDSDAALRARISQVVANSGIGHWSEDALTPVFGVEPGYIERALDQVEAAGGIESFLLARVGLPNDTLGRLRDALLAP